METARRRGAGPAPRHADRRAAALVGLAGLIRQLVSLAARKTSRISGNRRASLRRIDLRAFLSDRAGVTGAELLRKLQKLGRRRGVRVVFRAERGKGSHGTLYYGDRFTTLKDRHKELSPSLLSAMLKQLGLSRQELQEIYGAAKSMGG